MSDTDKKEPEEVSTPKKSPKQPPPGQYPFYYPGYDGQGQPMPYSPYGGYYPPPTYGVYPYPVYPGHPPPYYDPDQKKKEATDKDDDEPSGDEGDEDESNSDRLKTYIKPRYPTSQDILDRRARKNAQSRARAARLRMRIAEIEQKPEAERTEEEINMWRQYEARRQRKNNRSRDRAMEKKEEVERILAKPDKKRTKIEKQFLEAASNAKKRKNEGDRLRRQRMKELGLSTKNTGFKPNVSARGPLPQVYPNQQQYNPYQAYPPMPPPPAGYPGNNPGDIPMSPLPHLYYVNPLASPGGPFSPGLGGVYPSPQRGTPGRRGDMPFMPPPHAYADHASSPGRVEQRRNPDGTTTISIGGRSGQDYQRSAHQGEVDHFFDANKSDDGDNDEES